MAHSIMKKKLLVLSIESFSGRALCNAMNSPFYADWEIHGTWFSNLHNCSLASSWELDVTNREAVERVISEVKPSHIINFAGWTNGSEPHMFYMVHAQGALNILLAAKKLNTLPRILMIGTAAEYGPQESRSLPTNENQDPQPVGYYGQSKLLQSMLCRVAWLDWKLPVMIARSFNLIGPGLPGNLAPSIFAQQIKQVLCGNQQSIQTGPLTSKRDFIDIRDAISAYL
ncbi:MAG: NAD-dependent epimerase/dehydratase family protein, partial [Candidatus Omnitrophica bacterium]|nr:NAD-dependent epimerase/dehydratase family protein [Candidatus Omnitrophota bacterium]